MGVPSAAVRPAEASIPSARVPGLSSTSTTSKWVAPSGETKRTLLICSTLPVTGAMMAGMEICAV
ncbi:Uncharacterised protein [Flavonifractor plautii]|uniref:Uncharacterized protein n=1 Tax=Flavonifractor plautii TaxID=292800 RepID=A0A174SJF7_FLAPL|nr:Uncharacterised protein [Flavonifractor plautii]